MNSDLVDYSPFLDQARVWPQNHGDMKTNTAIEDMAPQHAISAYRKLLGWGLGSPRNRVNECRLANALLEQAVGEPVWLLSSVDIPAQALDALRKRYQPDSVSLELCFDAIAFLDKYSQGNSEHEVTKALRLQGYLNDKLWKEKHD